MKPPTPTLDKYRLHSFGGHCTCFSSPFTPCVICEAVKEHKKRWDGLTPELREKAKAELYALDRYEEQPTGLTP